MTNDHSPGTTIDSDPVLAAMRRVEACEDVGVVDEAAGAELSQWARAKRSADSGVLRRATIVTEVMGSCRSSDERLGAWPSDAIPEPPLLLMTTVTHATTIGTSSRVHRQRASCRYAVSRQLVRRLLPQSPDVGVRGSTSARCGLLLLIREHCDRRFPLAHLGVHSLSKVI